MTKEEVIERFCKLADEVNENRFKYSVAADCFCKESSFSDRNFQFEEDVIAFIEKATRNQLEYYV